MSDPDPELAALRIVDITRRKRDGYTLTTAEIEFIAQAATCQADPTGPQLASEAQLAAWLMAAFTRGLDGDELHALTSAMRFSGEVCDPSALDKFAVDKHSTGGVGDSTSFIVAPIAAAAGLAVPMISGRALGHTGGTLDKLDSIPGFSSQLSLLEMRAVLKKVGASSVGQTRSLVPADRVLYALRDHIGAVESPELICASIMSKKLAEALHGLVLDVKTGSGAFLKRIEDSLYLASLMVRTGEASGTRTVALITDMNQPLGRFSGNWVEIWEAVDILAGRSHPLYADLRKLSIDLAGWMLHLGEKAETPETGCTLAEELLTTGPAFANFKAMIEAQGGDISVFEDPAAFHQPAARKTLLAPCAGYLTNIDTEKVGWAVQRLGAGREKVGDPVDAHAGVEMHVKLGERIQPGQPLVTLFAAHQDKLIEPEALLHESIGITSHPSRTPPLVYEYVTIDNANRYLNRGREPAPAR